jgi:hypothetical protein
MYLYDHKLRKYDILDEFEEELNILSFLQNA